MHILLVNKQGQPDHPLLVFLDKELGDDIRQHVSVGGASTDQLNLGKKSIVAVADVETDEQIKEIEAAVKKFGSPSFEIIRGGIEVESTPVGGNFAYDAIAGEGGEEVFAEVKSVENQPRLLFNQSLEATEIFFLNRVFQMSRPQ